MYIRCVNIVSLVFDFKVYAMHWDKASIASKNFFFQFLLLGHHIFLNEIQHHCSTVMQLIEIKQKQLKRVYKILLLMGL